MAELKMKGTKLIALLVLFLLILTVMTGCAKEISRTPIDKRFIPAHSEMWSYIQMLPNGKGGMRAQPMIRTVFRPDCYQVLYLIEYDNGKSSEIWETVSKETYKETVIK